MRSREFAEVGFAILGVYFVVSGIARAGMLVGFGAPGTWQQFGVATVLQLIPGFLPFFTWIVAGVLLLVGRHRLAALFAGRDIEPGGEPGDGFLSQAIALLGLYLFVSGISETTGHLMTWRAWPKEIWLPAIVVASLTSAVLGVVLFVGARGIANLWRRIRYHRSGSGGGC